MPSGWWWPGSWTLGQMREGPVRNAALLQGPRAAFPCREMPAEGDAPPSPSLALPPRAALSVLAGPLAGLWRMYGT